MAQIEDFASNLIKALENKDFQTYNRSRVALVAAISDSDFMAESIQDHFIVGKALVILLDDLSATGIIYRRVVLTALYCLVNVVVTDKYEVNQRIAVACAYLFILFAENQDFIGGEYIVQKIKGSIETAVHQVIGMMCVFLWKYNSCSVKLEERTSIRLKKSISDSITDSPDEMTKKKIIDFEYNNFQSMIHDLPYDILLKYPGVPFFDPEIVFPKIKAMFNSCSLYFPTPSHQTVEASYNTSNTHSATPTNHSNSTSFRKNTTANTSSNSGCLSSIIVAVIVIVTIFLI